MREIAREVGVSYSTVSFVLSDRDTAVRISQDTRQRVLQAAQEMGYRRNEMARAVVSGRSRFLGFLVVEPDYEPVAHMLAGALDEADEADYFIKVLRARDFRIDTATIDRCLSLRIEGLIALYLVPGEFEKLHDELSRYQIPIALLEAPRARSWGAHIYSDDMDGCHQVIEHLISLGHKRIAFMAGKEDSEGGELRREGFVLAMKNATLEVPLGYIISGNWDALGATRATRELLQHPMGRPTAIFCANDQMALATIRTLRSVGLQVPKDMSVVGYTDLAMAEYCDPPLTTVLQPFHEMGRAAVRQLLSLMHLKPEQRDQSCDQVLPTRLVVRSSTASPSF